MFSTVHMYLMWQFWISLVSIMTRFLVAAYKEKFDAGLVIVLLGIAYFLCWEVTLLGWW